jgi:hypothetical protein
VRASYGHPHVEGNIVLCVRAKYGHPLVEGNIVILYVRANYRHPQLRVNTSHDRGKKKK